MPDDTPLARRMPGYGAPRHLSRRARRMRGLMRLAVLIVALVVLIVVVVWATGSSKPAKNATPPATPGATTATSTATPAIESGLLPWSLAAPISRSVVLPGSGTQVVVLGGLTSGNRSASGVYSLDTATGTLSQVGALSTGLHDGGGTMLGGRYVLFGGGSPNTVATVQAFTPGQAGAKTTATVIGHLPQPRSDDAAVTVGSTAYVVGGYDGTNADPEVLATTDGSTFRNVATLPVPVRYPAVAVAGGKLYVFGGQAVSGAGQPVNAIQMVDPAARKATVVGHLPIALAATTVVTLAGHIYLAGGESPAAQPITPGMGTTQVTPPSGGNLGAGASGAIPDAYQVPAAGAPAAGSAGSPAVLTGDRLAASSTTTTSASGTTTPSGSVSPVSTIWAFDPATDKLAVAGRLQVPVSHAAAAVVGSRAWLVGGEVGAAQQSAVQMLTPNSKFGTAGAPGAGSPYFGAKLLVADRGNNRLLLFDDTLKVVWTYPSATSPSDPLGFYFPDDAFFIKKGTAIISNQEENETIVQIAYPSGKILWSYGHPKQTGTAPGYLHEPDDAYLLKNGQISVADAQNCRVVVINPDGTVAHQIGTNGSCVHRPPTSMGSPNGDTPLANGNLLVSEINGSWISEYTLTGQLVWTVHVPVSYPSDPQQLGPDLYLLADYAKPGGFIEFTREGQVTYSYGIGTGPGELNHPSLAEQLPSGVIMINDDYSNRMVAIDPTTQALVWQYGVTNSAGTAPGMLNTPDGFDILMPDGSTPTHPTTG